ncbi:MAG: S8 family serine peptidase [Deltaproteobacteria bacterium]|nr:S8 family serine peptidase [Deltaproteobacteria bacterium]
MIGARLIDLFSQLPPLPAHEGPNLLLKIATPEAEGDSAKAPPSMATRQAEAAVLTSFQRSRVEERLAERPLFPGAIGTGSDGPKDVPMAPFGGAARRQAAQVLSGGAPVSADDPYVRAQRQVGEQLDRLGLRPRSEARIHIDEHLIEHGAGFTRAAAGEASLLRGGEVTLKTGAPANALARATLSKDQLARLESLPAREDRLRRGDGDLAEVVELGVDHLERQLLDKKVRIAGINRAVPNDGKLTLVNTSWGDNVYVVAESQAAYLGDAPEGSRQHQEATRLLGYPPRKETSPEGFQGTTDEDHERLAVAVGERIAARMAEPEIKARFDRARGELDQELAAGRKKNVLVFSAAMNDYQQSARLGHPEWSAVTEAGVPNLINVGAVGVPGATGKPVGVAPFSSAGPITLAAPGVDIPVGEFDRPTGSGTSYASPIALQTAALMHAANPNLTADQLAQRLVDPRVTHDVPGTDRDGAGRLDPFAAVLSTCSPGPVLTNAAPPM